MEIPTKEHVKFMRKPLYCAKKNCMTNLINLIQQNIITNTQAYMLYPKTWVYRNIKNTLSLGKDAKLVGGNKFCEEAMKHPLKLKNSQVKLEFLKTL